MVCRPQVVAAILLEKCRLAQGVKDRSGEFGGLFWSCACVISYHASISRLDPFFESVLIDKYRMDKNQASDREYKLQV